MSLRERGGRWHHRFFAAGRTWTADTGLAATGCNRVSMTSLKLYFKLRPLHTNTVGHSTCRFLSVGRAATCESNDIGKRQNQIGLH